MNRSVIAVFHVWHDSSYAIITLVRFLLFTDLSISYGLIL